MFLADEFIEGARAHPGGEGSGGAHGFFVRLLGGVKQVLHDQKIRSANRGAPYIRAHAKDCFLILSLFFVSFALAQRGITPAFFDGV